ncbi:phosphotransferase [Nocardia gipuzkoensis]|uniref:phosphotransferase n=1 Tax=Nocardia gipuzkoensis TaxID=2749991 RepID=UPI001E584689|nr:phosphotransferase [Nocardia gipuzkoensis]UGT67955.1 phosphotransferase [Nocardia gipuzkoensis]
MTEIPMEGGFISRAVRVGDTVHRQPGPHAEFIHQLLRHLEDRGWRGAPRFLGMDALGREMLTYLGGHVPHSGGQPPVTGPQNLVAVANLLRQLHDLTAGTPLARDQEVVCHNDLSPKNTVYDSSAPTARPVAFIDWDLAAPGARIHDVAHLCWQYLNLGPGIDDVAQAASQLQLVCNTYGLNDHHAVVDTILWWQQRCWRGIESRAAAGEAAMIALRGTGTVEAIRAAHHWVHSHRVQLTSAGALVPMAGWPRR